MIIFQQKKLYEVLTTIKVMLHVQMTIPYAHLYINVWHYVWFYFKFCVIIYLCNIRIILLAVVTCDSFWFSLSMYCTL